ncbi:hypothetical protein GGI20_003000 [Coemansia sp. BCRC 34301]|nr:hypothetical protein GGI20_003000 [Coemansia sp. BCRC 34301]
MLSDLYENFYVLNSVAETKQFSKFGNCCLFYAANDNHGISMAFSFHVYTGITTAYVYTQTGILHTLRTYLTGDTDVYVMYLKDGKAVNVLPDVVDNGLSLALEHCSYVPTLVCASTDYVKYYRFMLRAFDFTRERIHNNGMECGVEEVCDNEKGYDEKKE